MIIARIFGVDVTGLPKDFGSLVTKENVRRHLKKQKQELEQHLKSHKPQ